MARNLLKKIQMVERFQAEAKNEDREASMMRALKRTLGMKKKKKKNAKGKIAVEDIAEEEFEDEVGGQGRGPDAMASRRRGVPDEPLMVIEDLDGH